MEFKASTLEQLPHVCTEVIHALGDKKILLFDAPMGAGKTTFISEFCKQLGVENEVSSPTYSIVNEYHTDEGKVIYHFDLYRLKSLEEVMDIGFEEYIDSGKLCLIEWPEIAMPLFNSELMKLTINVDDHERSYVIRSL